MNIDGYKKILLTEKFIEDLRDSNKFLYNCNGLSQQERDEEFEKYKEHIKKYIK